MGNVNTMLRDIPLPRFVKVRQDFPENAIPDLGAEVLRRLQRPEVAGRVLPGMRIAITAGSRGVDRVAEIIRTVAGFLKSRGAKPFIVPAMGSHGGATAEGQKAILTEYGITEDAMGCPIVSSMDVKQIGSLETGEPVYIDRNAAEADGIVLVNRIKSHTAFRATYESGLMKMMTIGLGKQLGAETCHKEGILRLGPNVERFAFGILANANILFGVGTVENAFDKAMHVRVLTKEEIPAQEHDMLLLAREQMGRIYLPDADVLIVDRIGKNISGEGMDPNVTGRWIVPGIDGGFRAKTLAALDLTDETLGNGLGLGMADVSTMRAFRKYDFDATYPNSLTSTVTCLCKLPMLFDNQKLAIQAAIKMAWAVRPEDATVVRIRDTLSLGELTVSENLVPRIRETEGMAVVSDPFTLDFNENGDLF